MELNLDNINKLLEKSGKKSINISNFRETMMSPTPQVKRELIENPKFPSIRPKSSIKPSISDEGIINNRFIVPGI